MPIVKASGLALDEWLRIILSPDDTRKIVLYPDFCFPTNTLRDEYLKNITSRSRTEIKNLIRAFLMPTGTLGADYDQVSRAIDQDAEKAMDVEHLRRTIRGDPPWEGITWVLDLLHRPRMALQVLEGYLAAHFWWLPDWRMQGLFDAMRLIRAAFLEPLQPRDELLAISPREFEYMIALLFKRMHFDVVLTQQTVDGGFDVLLKCTSAGNSETSIVECKRYVPNVPVKDIRSLLGVVERDHLTRGLLVTTARFTRAARKESEKTNRIELVDFEKLCGLFNEHFGRDWLGDIDVLLTTAHREFDKNKEPKPERVPTTRHT